MHSFSARLVVLAVAVASRVLVAVLMGIVHRPYVVTAIDYHFHDAQHVFTAWLCWVNPTKRGFPW